MKKLFDRRARRWLASGAAASLVPWLCAASGDAHAQPNPFEDYERWQSGESAAPMATQVPDPPVAAGPVVETGPWNWSLGLRSQLSFGWSSYGRRSGDNGTASNSFFRLAPELETFVFERVQVGFSAGLYTKAASNTPGDSTSEAGMLIEATARYYAPVSDRFYFVPGVGLGGYFGSGSRTFSEANLQPVSDDTSTGGFSAALYLGVAYQLLEHFELRSGVAVNAMLGSETPDSRARSFSSYTTHVGIPVGIYYNF